MSTQRSNRSEIYHREFAILELAETALAKPETTKTELTAAFETLKKSYRSLLSQVVKITSTGDSAQSKLLRVQDELRTTVSALEKAQQRMRTELAMARQIQRQLLPMTPPAVPGVEIQSEYIALDEVGGDFLDYLLSRDGSIGILVGDATGHGVPAALLASMAKMTLDSLRDYIHSPHDLLKHVNNALLGKTNNNFVTCVYLVFRPGERVLKYATAGHPPPIFLRAGEKARNLPGTGQMLGCFDEPRLKEHTAEVDSGDQILLVTDGILDCRDAEGTTLDGDNLLALIDRTRSADGRLSLPEFVEAVRKYTGTAGFDDDVTAVLLTAR